MGKLHSQKLKTKKRKLKDLRVSKKAMREKTRRRKKEKEQQKKEKENEKVNTRTTGNWADTGKNNRTSVWTVKKKSEYESGKEEEGKGERERERKAETKAGGNIVKQPRRRCCPPTRTIEQSFSML